MSKLSITTNPALRTVFEDYPDHIRPKLEKLRNLVLETAEETENLTQLEETLKWGEPSYLAKKGSTIRMDWKAKTPNQYAMYFKCTSQLVPTFKVIYPHLFQYEGTRAIVFQLDDPVPEEALKHCIKAALTYHRVKHLPLLGMQADANRKNKK